MIVTYDVIDKVMKEADAVMQLVFPKIYVTPTFTRVRISKAESYWMKIRSFRSRPGEYELSVSRMFECYDTDNRAWKRMLESMIHELIHTLPNGMNHGWTFKYYCSRVMVNFPEYTLATCTGPGEGFVAAEKVIHYQYMVRCTCCGLEDKYQRESKVVKFPEKYRCGKCGGRLISYKL